jgi:ribA/ribD-fused uncharacterized protein
MIDSFTGDFDFLSNFYPSSIVPWSLGEEFLTVENAFQASKTFDRVERKNIMAASPGEAKRLGRKVLLRPDWEDVKIDVMRKCLKLKFLYGTRLADKLVATHPHELVEGNYWGDTFWGVCDGEGENWLGRLLMERRDQLMGR